MDIKLSLPQLFNRFAAGAANEEWPAPIREFAAQLTVLVAHMTRLENKIDGEAKLRGGADLLLDQGLAEVATLVQASRPAQAPQQQAPQAVQQPAPDQAAPEVQGEEAAVASVLAETERQQQADMAAENTPPMPVTALRKVGKKS